MARLLASRQRRLRQIAGDSPGDDHALPHERCRSEEGRHHRRQGASVDRPRIGAGPDRRSGPLVKGCRADFPEMKLEIDGKTAFAYTANHELDPKKRTVVFI